MTWADDEMDRMDRIEERIVDAASKVSPDERLDVVYRAASPFRLTLAQAKALQVLADKRAAKSSGAEKP